MGTSIDISVVIVSMNNPFDLIRCVDSILNNNKKVNIEIMIVLFNFTEENFSLISRLSENCKFFHSKGIRGFSANNNIALREATGNYVLVLNDDTFFNDNSLEQLYFSSSQNSILISSPVLVHFDNKVQFYGRPKFHILSVIMHEFKLQKYLPFIHKDVGDYFETFNVSGACFLIDRLYFEQLGWFDEDYFFTPEDIAIGTLSRVKHNVYPVVFKKLTVFHKGSSTAKSIFAATMPTAKQGVYLMFGKLYGPFYEIMLRAFLLPVFIFKYFYWKLRNGDMERKKIMLSAFGRCIKLSFVKRNTTVLFSDLYGR